MSCEKTLAMAPFPGPLAVLGTYNPVGSSTYVGRAAGAGVVALGRRSSPPSAIFLVEPAGGGSGQALSLKNGSGNMGALTYAPIAITAHHTLIVVKRDP